MNSTNLMYKRVVVMLQYNSAPLELVDMRRKFYKGI
jgi:hypothetical protein